MIHVGRKREGSWVETPSSSMSTSIAQVGIGGFTLSLAVFFLLHPSHSSFFSVDARRARSGGIRYPPPNK